MNKDAIIYLIYARKSSEAEDRQTLSIGSQVDECKRIAIKNNVKFLEENVLTESHSAKEAYSRPVFEKMVKDIESGKIQGVIAWHPNRLSRNAIDTARLVDLFDRGKLREIITHQQIFRNTPSDKFVFQLLCSQAKLENDNKGIDVKRGLRKKYTLGYPPCLSKIGFINDDKGKKGEKIWLPDPKRLPLVKQILELFLKGNYSVRKMQKYADEVLGLRTIQRRKEGGRPLSISAMYNLLADPFNAGFFYAKDEDGNEVRYEAHQSLPRIISEEKYWLIQTRLGKKGKPCPSKYIEAFPYKRFMQCGSCGGPVTAEHKFQLICPACKKKFSYPNKTNCPFCGIKIMDMENPKYLHYIYYHCIKKPRPECKKSLQETMIDDDTVEYFSKNIQISSRLRDWCLKHFQEIIQKEKQNEFERRVAWEIEKEEKEKQYVELIKMKTRGAIEEDDFLKLKESLKGEIKKAEDAITSTGGSVTEAMEKARQFFNMAVGVREIFENGGFREKDKALSEICSNLTLEGGKAVIHEKESYMSLKMCIQRSKRKNRAFEPAIYGENKGKTESFDSVRPTWLRR